MVFLLFFMMRLVCSLLCTRTKRGFRWEAETCSKSELTLILTRKISHQKLLFESYCIYFNIHLLSIIYFLLFSIVVTILLPIKETKYEFIYTKASVTTDNLSNLLRGFWQKEYLKQASIEQFIMGLKRCCETSLQYISISASECAMEKQAFNPMIVVF